MEVRLFGYILAGFLAFIAAATLPLVWMILFASSLGASTITGDTGAVRVFLRLPAMLISLFSQTLRLLWTGLRMRLSVPDLAPGSRASSREGEDGDGSTAYWRWRLGGRPRPYLRERVAEGGFEFGAFAWLAILAAVIYIYLRWLSPILGALF